MHTVATTTPSLHSESFPDNGTVIELLLKQKKNMRVSYRARVVNGQPMWILKKDLLPKYSTLVKKFNADQLANTSLKHGPSLLLKLLLEKPKLLLKQPKLLLKQL